MQAYPTISQILLLACGILASILKVATDLLAGDCDVARSQGVHAEREVLLRFAKVTAMEMPPQRKAGRVLQGDAAAKAKELVRLLHDEAKLI